MQLRLSHCPVSGPGFKWPVQPAETCWDNKNEHPATSCIASAPALYGRGRVPVSGFRCRVQRGITEFYKAAFFRQPSLMALCFTMWVQGSVLAWNRLSITPEMRNPVNYSGAQKIEHALSSTGMPWHPPVSSFFFTGGWKSGFLVGKNVKSVCHCCTPDQLEPETTWNTSAEGWFLPKSPISNGSRAKGLCACNAKRMCQLQMYVDWIHVPSRFERNLCLNWQAKHILVGTRANRFQSSMRLWVFAWSWRLPTC